VISQAGQPEGQPNLKKPTVLRGSGQFRERMSRRSRKGAATGGSEVKRRPHQPVEPETIDAWSRQPRAKTFGNKGAVALRCNTGNTVA